jgi:hypothetical protein
MATWCYMPNQETLSGRRRGFKSAIWSSVLRSACELCGYHCWAKYFAPGLDWIPVDASCTCKYGKHHLFGDLEMNYIAWSVGRDVELNPRKRASVFCFSRGLTPKSTASPIDRWSAVCTSTKFECSSWTPVTGPRATGSVRVYRGADITLINSTPLASSRNAITEPFGTASLPIEVSLEFLVRFFSKASEQSAVKGFVRGYRIALQREAEPDM